MKLSCLQENLAKGLSIVSRAVAARSTLPVLGNILLATDNGRLKLSATNLELGITCWIGAKIEEEGSTTVPARTLSDLISTMPDPQVNLTLDARTQTLNLRSGSSTNDIKGIDAQEFPPMPASDPSEGVSMKVSDFKEMVQQVAFAASSDEARPVLQGVQTTINGDEISMAATDGFRISVRKSQLSEPARKPSTMIIPARALNEISRIAQDSDTVVTLISPPGRGQVIFHLETTELVSQLIDGNFPDYKVIVPRGFRTHTIISAPALLKACKQAEIIARNGNNVVRLNLQKFDDRPGEVEISSQSEETGSNETHIDANIDGPALVIAFNVRYLREALDVIHSPNVALETNANNTPAMLRPVGDDGFQHVIMPMHLA